MVADFDLTGFLSVLACCGIWRVSINQFYVIPSMHVYEKASQKMTNDKLIEALCNQIRQKYL